MIEFKDINRLFLIGPMGSGKTTVGRRLAQALRKTFRDLDETLEQRTGVDVARIFDVEREAGFRAREAALLDELTRRDDIVLATGGGTILTPENRALLGERGLVVYLRTSVDLQLQRLERDKTRPLLQTPDRRGKLEQLAAERESLYLESADLVVDSAAVRPEVMADRIITLIRTVKQKNARKGAQPRSNTKRTR